MEAGAVHPSQRPLLSTNQFSSIILVNDLRESTARQSAEATQFDSIMRAKDIQSDALNTRIIDLESKSKLMGIVIP